MSTLSPKLIQGKFFLALTSAKEKKWTFFLTVLEFENNNNVLPANAKALHECC